MHHKEAKKGGMTEVKLRYDTALKARIRKFRAQKELENTPITSDEKAILHLIETGLQHEGQTVEL